MSDDTAEKLEGKPVLTSTKTNRITYPEDLKFSMPKMPSYSVLGSIFSLITLIFMSIFSTAILVQLTGMTPFWLVEFQVFIAAVLLPEFLGNETPFAFLREHPPWIWVPFAFTVFGSTLGALFEGYLLLIGQQFQFYSTAIRRFIARVRVANVVPVLMSLLFYVAQIAIANELARVALLLVLFALSAALVFNIMFTPPPVAPPPSNFVGLILMGAQLLSIGFVVFNELLSHDAGLALISGNVLMLIALLVTTATPVKSAGFHALATTATVLAYMGLFFIAAVNGGIGLEFIYDQSFELNLWWKLLASVIGLLVGFVVFPAAWGGLRAIISNIVWTFMYYNLVSAPRVPNPKSLEDIYSQIKGAKPDPTVLFPYSVAHPDYIPVNLAIPAVPSNRLSKIITIGLKPLYDIAVSGFKIIQLLDHSIPQANVGIPLKDQPRVSIWSNGTNYWSKFFRLKLPGKSMPNGGKLQPVPKPAYDAYKKGQLLAYLTESGVASTFLEADELHGDGVLKIDFRHLEKYEAKPDYMPYGGIAYFTIDEEAEELVLMSVKAPNSDVEVFCDPHCPAFRAAEEQVTASMYFEVVSGKHLAEIHMTLNLVEVSMENAFDAEGQWNHPFRTFMYLHFFAHQLAEELTTEHLTQEGAVFSQIFATTYDAMVEHLNDTYSAFNYGQDEDFDTRKKLLTMPGKNELLPKAAVKWELEYFNIWSKYTRDLIDTIYETDQDVVSDVYLQKFHDGLVQTIIQPLPERYHDFKTKEGVARFAADTIHHTVIRHQVYGTTGIRAATDPRISKLQVPKDDYTPGVDEYRSFLGVANATAYARFTLLTGPTGQDFTNLLQDVNEQYKPRMESAFTNLQTDLQELNARWTANELEKVFSYDYFRAVPEDVHTGPGY